MDLFAVGTELKAFAKKRPEFWKQLIQKVRTVYSGPLTYAANWDEYHEISFWQDLDYIGCLLYTSPSPRDATLSRMPSSA